MPYFPRWQRRQIWRIFCSTHNRPWKINARHWLNSHYLAKHWTWFLFKYDGITRTETTEIFLIILQVMRKTDAVYLNSIRLEKEIGIWGFNSHENSEGTLRYYRGSMISIFTQKIKGYQRVWLLELPKKLAKSFSVENTFLSWHAFL